jgi:hypothetical protein
MTCARTLTRPAALWSAFIATLGLMAGCATFSPAELGGFSRDFRQRLTSDPSLAQVPSVGPLLISVSEARNDGNVRAAYSVVVVKGTTWRVLNPREREDVLLRMAAGLVEACRPFYKTGVCIAGLEVDGGGEIGYLVADGEDGPGSFFFVRGRVPPQSQ